MTHTKTKIELVDGPYPSVKAIVGLSFRIPVVVSAKGSTAAEAQRRIADAERLVMAWNALNKAEAAWAT